MEGTHQFGKRGITMFTPVSLETKKLLHTAGKIYISVTTGWEMAPIENTVPYNIRYKKVSPGTYDDIVLYTCYITVSTKKIVFSSLKESPFMKKSLYSSERMAYVFLKMALEEIVIWAERTGRKRLAVISTLPHITEHFANLDFSIEKKYENFIGERLLGKNNSYP